MKKFILAYFNCGHAALQTPEGVVLYKMPPRLSLEAVQGYLPVELRGKTQLIAHEALFCGICHPKQNPQDLLAVLDATLQEEGILLTPAQLVEQARLQLKNQGVSEEVIKKILPASFLYQRN